MSALALCPRRGIVEVVLAVHRPGRRRHGVMAAGVAGCALLGLAASVLAPPFRARPEIAAARAPFEISFDDAVAPIAPTPPPPVNEPARAPRPRRSASAGTSRHVDARAPSPPPAQAAAAVAREVPPSAPVDMTAETLVVGGAKEYAGGMTTAGGTNTARGQGRGPSQGTTSAGTPGGKGLASAGAGRFAPVGLASQSWSCPWPTEAEDLPMDEQTVVIRVVVRPDGTAESVAIVSDPGHGFGQAASSCAMRTIFTPARAAGGEPVRATSAPIRVRFTRH